MEILPQFEDYKCISKLFESQTIKSYLCTQINGSNEEFFIKTVKCHSEREFNCHMRNAMTAAKFNHPNILNINDVFRYSDSSIFFCQVTKFYKIGSLDKFIHKNIPERLIMEIIRQILLGIGHIHTKKEIHGNIKPSNIIIKNFTKDSIEVALRDAEPSKYGNVIPNLYIAPEIRNGNECQANSDIWSLGCIIYELLVKKTVDLFGIVTEYGNKVDEYLKKELKEFNPNLVESVIRMISLDPMKRPNVIELYQILFHSLPYLEIHNASIYKELMSQNAILLEKNKQLEEEINQLKKSKRNSSFKWIKSINPFDFNPPDFDLEEGLQLFRRRTPNSKKSSKDSMTSSDTQSSDISITIDQSDHSPVSPYNIDFDSLIQGTTNPFTFKKTLIGHEKGIRSLTTSINGKYIFSGEWSRTEAACSIKMWDSEGQFIRNFDGHEWSIFSMCTTCDDQFLVSGGIDRFVRIWDIERGILCKELKHREAVWSVCTSTDNEWIVTGTYDKVYFLLWKFLKLVVC